MQKAAPRLLIAGTNSGCGKTTVTCAILQALVNAGVPIAAAKCGPTTRCASSSRKTAQGRT